MDTDSDSIIELLQKTVVLQNRTIEMLRDQLAAARVGIDSAEFLMQQAIVTLEATETVIKAARSHVQSENMVSFTGVQLTKAIQKFDARVERAS